MIKVGSNTVTFPYSKIYIGDTQVYPTPQTLSPYLESDGTQQIVTGLNVGDSNRVEIDFKFLDNTYTGTQWLAGGGIQSGRKYYSYSAVNSDFTAKANAKTLSWLNGLNKLADPPDTNRHTVIWGDDQYSQWRIQLDGVGVASYGGGMAAGTPPFNLFTDCQARIYSLKVYSTSSVSSTLLLDMTPTLDGNNAPCMYDSVSGNYFYDNNGGTFVYGEE